MEGGTGNECGFKVGVEKFPLLNTKVKKVFTWKLVYSKNLNEGMELAKHISEERVF